jgi:hypothetical protein
MKFKITFFCVLCVLATFLIIGFNAQNVNRSKRVVLQAQSAKIKKDFNDLEIAAEIRFILFQSNLFT